jgi:GH25 family lysozyme M1 (1,4-beta-N-acetylmuramidase)
MKEKVIDISEHNGNIDFEHVKKAGINKVIIRIGWIGNKENHTLDKKFNEYYKQARLYNFQIGFYVYSYCLTTKAIESGMRWAEKQICNKQVDLPVFIDMEDQSIYRCSNTELTRHVTTFCKFFKQKGYQAGVYASKYWFTSKFDINKILDYKIWLAEWNNKNNHTLKYKVDLWQYTSNGHVAGIKGRVDMNYCLCECDEKQEKIKEDFEMAKTYRNGSTPEVVYSDSSCSMSIGRLNPKEICECIGIVKNRYIVKYKIDGTANYKVGFVKYNGGIK